MKLWPGVPFPETFNLDALCALSQSRGWPVSGYIGKVPYVAIDVDHYIRWKRLPPVLKMNVADMLDSKAPNMRQALLKALLPYVEELKS